MSKYKKHFHKMLEENQLLFNEFKSVHDRYTKEKETLEEPFHDLGNKILRVIRRYENELCAKSENSGFGKFSSNLSEKFWEEIRAYFPHIDLVKLK
jgi:sugar-specific transcriptional regulator TrmB